MVLIKKGRLSEYVKSGKQNEKNLQRPNPLQRFPKIVSTPKREKPKKENACILPPSLANNLGKTSLPKGQLRGKSSRL